MESRCNFISGHSYRVVAHHSFICRLWQQTWMIASTKWNQNICIELSHRFVFLEVDLACASEPLQLRTVDMRVAVAALP